MQLNLRKRALGVLVATAALGLGPAQSLATPVAHAASHYDLLGGLLGGVTGSTTTTASTPTTTSTTDPLAPVTSLLNVTGQGGSTTQALTGAVDSLLGGTSTPPAPTPTALVDTL